MKRFLAVVPIIGLVGLVVAAWSPASASNPTSATITGSVVFGQGPPHGTFTAAEPLCPSGTFVDEFVGGGGQTVYALTVRETLTCADGSGTFTILFHPQGNPSGPTSCDESGPFAVVGGTGEFSKLHGHGDFCVVFGAGGTGTGTFSGSFVLP